MKARGGPGGLPGRFEESLGVDFIEDGVAGLGGNGGAILIHQL